MNALLNWPRNRLLLALPSRVSQPTRKGFGSVILVDVAKQFGQRIAVNYDPQGLSYELVVPLSHIEASKTSESIVPDDAFSFELGRPA